MVGWLVTFGMLDEEVDEPFDGGGRGVDATGHNVPENDHDVIVGETDGVLLHQHLVEEVPRCRRVQGLRVLADPLPQVLVAKVGDVAELLRKAGGGTKENERYE